MVTPLFFGQTFPLLVPSGSVFAVVVFPLDTAHWVTNVFIAREARALAIAGLESTSRSLTDTGVLALLWLGGLRAARETCILAVPGVEELRRAEVAGRGGMGTHSREESSRGTRGRCRHRAGPTLAGQRMLYDQACGSLEDEAEGSYEDRYLWEVTKEETLHLLGRGNSSREQSRCGGG